MLKLISKLVHFSCDHARCPSTHGFLENAHFLFLLIAEKVFLRSAIVSAIVIALCCHGEPLHMPTGDLLYLVIIKHNL